MTGKVRIFGPRDPRPIPEGDVNINVTSRSKSDRGKTLSPMHLGPVPLYWGLTAKKVENAWQFSKVYDYHVGCYGWDEELDEAGNACIHEKWFKWALQGFNDNWAHRYPMGKGEKPLFSFWAGERLDYISARKKIYIPLYSYAARKTEAFKWIAKQYKEGKTIHLWDFDGYNREQFNMSWEDILNNPKKIMGHGHVLAMMLEAPELVKD